MGSLGSVLSPDPGGGEEAVRIPFSLPYQQFAFTEISLRACIDVSLASLCVGIDAAAG